MSDANCAVGCVKYWEGELAAPQRRLVAAQVFAALAALALVAIAEADAAWFDLYSAELRDLLRVLASALVAPPLALAAARSTWEGAEEATSDWLMVVAVAAAWASGEFTAATLLPIVVACGHLVEQRGLERATTALAAWQATRQARARRVEEATRTEQDVPLEALRAGDLLLVGPGEPLPTDGVVVEGRAYVDEARVTGEWAPRAVAAGQTVQAGTINLDGRLYVRATAGGDEGSWRRVTELWGESLRAKPTVASRLDRWSAWWLPVVAVWCLGVLIATGEPRRAIASLIAGCPCALALAAPATYLSVWLVAARRGIFLRSARFLESLADPRVVLFDKTGTLTVGLPAVAAWVPFSGASEEELRDAAILCAAGGTHPLARALVATQPASGTLDVAEIERREFAGAGIRVVRADGTWRLGRLVWLRDEGVAAESESAGLPSHEGPIAFVARDGRCLGCVLLRDVERPEAADTLARLRALGAERQVLLTGDRRAAALPLAVALRLDEIRAELTPADKLARVREERDGGPGVVFIGDGANDAPAFAAADVGVAFGSRGSPLAWHAADVALASDDLALLPNAIELARRARRLLSVNLSIAVVAVATLLAAAAAGWVSPVGGAVLHHGGAVGVVLACAAWTRRELRVAATAIAAAAPVATDAPLDLPNS